MHPMSIDTLGFEPRAFRMRGGSDTTTPRAPGKITSLHVHRATTAGEVSWLWAQQEKSGPSVVQDDKTLLAVLEKGLRDRNSPSCTSSQNGYGDLRVKARKCSCCLPLDKITALHEHWGEQAKRLRSEQEKRWSSMMQDEKLPPAVCKNYLRDRNRPMCTLSQNCYGARRIKARKYTCFLTLANTTALHACARGEEKKRRGYGASRRSAGHP